MNPYPRDNSVLVLDNCAIHKSAALREMVEAQSEWSKWLYILLYVYEQIYRICPSILATVFTRFQPY